MTSSGDIVKAFYRLFGGPDWSIFERAAFKYFDANSKDFRAHAKFFEYFTPQWRQFCSVGRYNEGANLWAKAIEVARKWEKKPGGRHIHKGTPFYFWGGTELLKGDIDMGFVLIHEAYNEDVLAESFGAQSADALPAGCFVLLKHEVQEQYWGQLVQELAEFLEARISTYNRNCGRSLGLEQFKAQFLQIKEYREAAFFFIYSLWKFKRHFDTNSDFINSSFSILMQLDAALNLYVVLEAILKEYYGNKKSLHPLIIDFSKAHHLDVHRCATGSKLSRIDSLKKLFEKDPDAIISKTLSCSIPDHTMVQVALSVAPLLRNAAAHSVRSYAALHGQASMLLQTTLTAIFAAIDLGKA